MEEKHICDYGCGQEAIYKIGKKWCCSKSLNSCPSKKERSRCGGTGKKHDQAKPIETEKICSFGCNQRASFIYKNGSYCCKNDWHKCSGKHEQISKTLTKIWSDLDRRERFSRSQRKDLFAKAIPVLEDDKICQNCGQKAFFWFKTNNRYCCSDRIERCPVVKEEIRLRSIELWKDTEFRNKITSQDYNNPNRVKKISESNTGKIRSKETRELFRFLRKGKTFEELFGEEKANELKNRVRSRVNGKTYEELYGEEKSKITKQKISKKLKGRKERRKEIKDDMSYKKKIQWEDPKSTYNSKEFRKKKSEEGKRNWKNPEYIKKIQKGLHNCPNKSETVLINLFKDLNLDYKFVGDWSLNIDGKNPDFINYKSKKLIEFFGSYYHDTIVETSREVHEIERINHFKKNGYECLIIWEEELQDLNKLSEKLIRFSKKISMEV